MKGMCLVSTPGCPRGVIVGPAYHLRPRMLAAEPRGCPPNPHSCLSSWQSELPSAGSGKMSQSTQPTAADEGATFQHLWSSL